ncbi:VWA domain-containing protein [Croceibacterium sp. LX-88]|uniref:VWA domain-containing protein n=1 Tax=Croceibacterium selenioxidans TaxID=2838833 RepID=A0ABS5VZ44_9SPHN|nr:VWA domain-containing protein [Croceibacterium selenioxidans]MBT2132797.1 VWA domain-containing protein [Croceibacterium selenioxidans]
MSHICGTVPVLSPSLHVGPDTGEAATSPNVWEKDLTYSPAPGGGTKFIILHFMNVTLPANNRLEVDLGYDTDVFTSASGGSFWTRPINVGAVGASIKIRYITNGAGNGGAFVDRYGRGESLQSTEPGHNSITNCNPFLINGWVEPNFPHIPGSTDPKYDPFWICNKSAAPKWQNVRCAPVGSPQDKVARSVGMIVSIHQPSSGHPEENVSTCSVTLIDSDLVVLAAHCISDHPFEVPTSSVTFDYEVACDGSLLPAYNAVFYKVIKLVKFRFTDGRDYAILQIRGTPPLSPVPVRITNLGANEAVFGVHHPNGAVKKVSPSASGTMPISFFGTSIGVNLDVAGGSSGSGLFDASGHIVGVLSNGSGCSLSYSALKTMMADPIVIPNPPTQRAVMLVFDRSGSMSEGAGGGKIKINEARAAAELFVNMIRTTGNRAGLISFSNDATSPVDFALAPVTTSTKSQINGKLAAISPSGATSIGDGLAVARDQLAGTSGLPKTILLLTDGMENEPQKIADVSGLGAIEITAIGFGAESNLDGAKLSGLAQSHGGLYKRAGDGLQLKKFFALAFGEIFEAGSLADPQLHLPASLRVGPSIPFHVCGEEAVTIVIGWDNEDAPLFIELESPSGQIVNLGAGGIDSDAGTTWRFARVPLPQGGERDGVWKTRVFRPGGGEFPPPAIPVNYFVNVNARGGPSLRPFIQPQRIYTGDVLHPKVILQFADESVPPGGSVSLAVRRPAKSVGTLIANKGLAAATTIKGDVLPERQSTLKKIEQDTGAPATDYVDSNYVLSDEPEGSEMFEPAGIFGARLDNVLVVDGTYTFHARATVAINCTTTRECQWSYHVAVGIDPGSTTVTTQPNGTGPTGGDKWQVIFTPQDKYGNLVGPGMGDDLDVQPLPGGTLVGGLVDLGDGRYVQEVETEPGSDADPGLTVGQPDRGPVVVAPPSRIRTGYRYTTSLACGVEGGECCDCSSVVPGRFATAVTAYNGTEKDVALILAVIPTTFAGATSGRWPDAVSARAKDRMVLKPGEATTIDCCSIARMLLGAPAPAQGALTFGVVALECSAKVDVSATYTVAGREGEAPSIDVEALLPSEFRVREARPAPPPPPPPPAKTRDVPPPRPQDIPRQREKEERPETGKARPKRSSQKPASSRKPAKT